MVSLLITVTMAKKPGQGPFCMNQQNSATYEDNDKVTSVSKKSHLGKVKNSKNVQFQ
jgi:hypothetical protein